MDSMQESIEKLVIETTSHHQNDDISKSKFLSKNQHLQDTAMTSSIISITSSLTSPVDSGVQLLDSESDIASVMSMSGFGCDLETLSSAADPTPMPSVAENMTDSKSDSILSPRHGKNKLLDADIDAVFSILTTNDTNTTNVMTKSDIANQNTTHFNFSLYSSSAPNVEYAELTTLLSPDGNEDGKFEETVTKLEEMHVSMSEEVNESVNNECCVNDVDDKNEQMQTSVVGEEIVFRRQRKKKSSKSDTPKKRVSFHEDILNSTKIDDIHINHGFVTHEPDISMSFFLSGAVRKADVVKGRYSWAAEGDSPYYTRNVSEREAKSDLLLQNRYSSTSSSSCVSSSGLSSSSNSIDEEDPSTDEVPPPVPLKKLPKSSCLKKTKHRSKYIDTNVVQEEPATNLRKKRSETNLLDTNIFGSLKNMLSFSNTVSLAERGVPEGQEDITVFSSSHEVSSKRNSLVSNPESAPISKSYDGYETSQPIIEKRISNLNLHLAKTNLRLTPSEGFYPNYPNQELPANIVLCDSNVYEHKGISYSYEYDMFQKNFEKQNKPKSSTVYQMLLREFNFFRKRAKEPKPPEVEERDCRDDWMKDADGLPDFSSKRRASKGSASFLSDTETVSEATDPSSRRTSKNNTDWISDSETISDFTDSNHQIKGGKTPTSPKRFHATKTPSSSDWLSDTTDTVSDFTDLNIVSKHLNSPKRKVSKTNHYSVQRLPTKSSDTDSGNKSSLLGMRPASSKTSLINRFLRTVTMKKMIDNKVQKKEKIKMRVLDLYIKGVKPDAERSSSVDRELEEEIRQAHAQNRTETSTFSDFIEQKLKYEIFRNHGEQLLNLFQVRSAYTTNGENIPLMIALTDCTLYIIGARPNHLYCNHFVLPYVELNTIIIGPNAQTVHISNYDNDMHCMVATGCLEITDHFVGQLEIAMRRDPNKPRLAAVKQLSMRDMINLRRAVCKQTPVDKDDDYYYYSLVNLQDGNGEQLDMPMGPTKEGPLMFRTQQKDSRWETAYFILKAGVLYMLSSPTHRLPMKVMPLCNGSCQGARRTTKDPRPHTFELLINGTPICLAAPDEYVASEWLQALVQAASASYNHREINTSNCCSLLMTSEHILSVREAFPLALGASNSAKFKHLPIKGTQTLSYAAISDLAAFRLPSAEQSWCILEFACREVNESSGDWIVYFATNSELERFISTLELLWNYQNDSGESFPISMLEGSDVLNKRCSDTYKSLQNSWGPLLLSLQ